MPDLLYHVVARGIERRRIYGDDADRDFFLARMGRLVSETGINVYSFALIPNHFHLLVRRGPVPLSSFMQRLLTGYAIHYNRKHRRAGHLFQNRYKAVICEDDSYFTELVRYICLNPLRAGLVENIRALESFRYSAYAYILGRQRAEWFDEEPVLGFFGTSRATALRAFRKHVGEVPVAGEREGLSGGELKRSLGLPDRLPRERHAFDQRVLNSGDFVEAVHATLEQAVTNGGYTPTEIIAATCRRFGLTRSELVSGSRNRKVSAARAHAVRTMVEKCPISKSEIARSLAISLPAVLFILKKDESRV